MTEQPLSSTDENSAAIAARLAELERENQALRRLVAERPDVVVTSAPVVVAAPRPRRHWARATAAAVLITLGVILAPLAVVAHWAQRELTDTDRYLATIGPLASDPVVQSALEGALTTAIMAEIDVPSLVEDVSSSLDDQGMDRASQVLTLLEGSLTSGIESFVRNIAGRVIESDAFETVWLDANRVAHQQLVAVLQGDQGNVVQLSDQGALTIQLSGVIEQVKGALVDSGFGVAANIPEVNASFTVLQAAELVKLRNAYNLVVFLGTWLPWLSLGLIAAGVLTAVRRSRALMVAGLAVALSMLVLGLGLYLGRSLYLGALTGKLDRLDAAQVIFDQVVTFIRSSMRTVGVAGLVVALVAFLAGGSDTATTMRSGAVRGFAAARAWGDNRGVSTGPVGAWLFRYRRALRVTIVALAALVVFVASTLTPAFIVTVAVVAGILVGLVELLAAPPAVDAPEAAVPAAAAAAEAASEPEEPQSAEEEPVGIG